MGEREVPIPGVAGRVTVSPVGVFQGARISVDGVPAKRTGWGQVLLPRSDGSSVKARLVDHLTRTVPSLQIGDDKYQVGDAIPTFQVVLAALPLVLLIIGGAVGGLCGATAWGVNQAIIRSERLPHLKALMVAGVTVAATIAYLGLAILIQTGLA